MIGSVNCVIRCGLARNLMPKPVEPTQKIAGTASSAKVIIFAEKPGLPLTKGTFGLTRVMQAQSQLMPLVNHQ